MTRQLSEETFAALRARRLEARDFIWFVVKDRETSAAVYDGYWSDVGTMACDVIDPDTGGAATRQFVGAGSLISISDVQLVSSLTVQTVTVTLSQCADRVNDLVRNYQCKQGRIEIFRGLFDPDSRVIVAPVTPRFVGFIDHVEIKTPSEGDDGGVELTCVSHTQEMTRSNPDTRSDASQRLRRPDDAFYQDAATVSDWEHFWGKASGPINTMTIEKARAMAASWKLGG